MIDYHRLTTEITISKPRAFAIHVSISLLIFIVLAWFLVFRWFPGELFFIDGGWQGMRLIAAVDLILGPALTLIFYKPGKPGLVFDMSMIALVQSIALVYGVWSAQQQSTVALAFVDGRFVTVAYSALRAGDDEILEAGETPQSLDIFSHLRPVQVYVEPPARGFYGSYIAEVFNGKPELHERSHRFQTLENNLDRIDDYQLTVSSLTEQDDALRQRVIDYFEESNQSPTDFQIQKIKARYGRGLAIVDLQKKYIVDILRYSD